ncbi:MAG: helix-turn-helix transcriptional regulator [Alphaproteobacteria bacterium]|nr:helix-turn-helix transcriptional regulator [Alphaproteobacteria bacterium]
MRIKEQYISAAPLLQADANITEQHTLGRDVAVSTWSIGRNSVTYEKSDSHTLSLYLSGGVTSYRRDLKGHTGQPGVLCLMPQGHLSRWHIGGDIDFAHLYFSDAAIKRFAVDHFDKDARLVDLRDLTYEKDTTLKTLLLNYLETCRIEAGPNGLFGEQQLFALFDHLVAHYNGLALKNRAVKGGLAPHQMRRVKAAIFDQLDTRLTIAGLAGLTGLSPFHFARQFKESFGETPAHYITRQRVLAVVSALGSEKSLADIAAKTGFAQQSHMTTQFKRTTGYTPHAYRQQLKH